MSQLKLSRKDTARVKRPLPADVLTQHEVDRLLRVFVQDKTEILEDDALTLVKWVQGVRMGVLLLEMVLDGDLIPVVSEGVVKVGLPDRGRRA